MALRPFIRFSFIFRLLEGLIFAPLVAVLGQVLRGQMVVDSTALVGFFLSPRGFSAAIISAAIFLTLRFMENAGLSVLSAGQAMGTHPTSQFAFKHVVARSAAVGRATLLILAAGLALLVPLAVLAKFFAHRLLSHHDINYYLHAKPPEFIHAAVVLGAVAVATVAIGLWCAIRWRWVAQVLMFETTDVSTAFRRSAAMAQPVWLSIAGWWAAVGLVNLVLGIAGAWSGRIVLPLALGVLGKGAVSLGFIFGALWMMQGSIGAFFTMAGSVLEAQIFTRFYLRVSERKIDVSQHSTTKETSKWWVPLAGKLCMILAGGVLGAIWGSGALYTERPMLVIAHRGSMNEAPENTVAAVQQAIKDGADVVETDIQFSRDGVMVMAHDSDFSRLAGVAKHVSDLSWEEIKKLDVGGARPARLEEFLAASQGRIHFNLEPKHYSAVDGKLEEAIVRLVEKKGMVDQVEIQSLEFESLEIVRRLNPQIKIGYLMSVNARHPEDLPVDFLSAQMSRVDARFLRRAHKQGKKVYVWTVDEEEQMNKAQALGVDGLITNQSARAVAFVKKWASLSPNEKALRRLNFWLAK